MFLSFWEIELLRTRECREEHREKRPKRGGTPGEWAETERNSGRKAESGRNAGRRDEPGRNAGRNGRTGEKHREKWPMGRDRGEQGLDSESRGGGGDKTSKLTFSPPLSQVFPCGVVRVRTSGTRRSKRSGSRDACLGGDVRLPSRSGWKKQTP